MLMLTHYGDKSDRLLSAAIVSAKTFELNEEMKGDNRVS